MKDLQVNVWILSLFPFLYILQKAAAAENPVFFQSVSTVNLREDEKALKGISLWLQVTAEPPQEDCGVSGSVI